MKVICLEDPFPVKPAGPSEVPALTSVSLPAELTGLSLFSQKVLAGVAGTRAVWRRRPGAPAPREG